MAYNVFGPLLCIKILRILSMTFKSEIVIQPGTTHEALSKLTYPIEPEGNFNMHFTHMRPLF